MPNADVQEGGRRTGYRVDRVEWHANWQPVGDFANLQAMRGTYG